ncbi:MAG TPA: RnfABCDGE type electron transport complex subunit B [Casimicrobiaceae bacterium]|nr:RnfABCDGE type electron transport complex subunit B [Casimicrobiaceae bacterium]
MNATLAERLDAALPQTQCTRCGYDGCRPYAEALAAGAADVNRCPPGGPQTIRALAQIAGREAKPLDRSCGAHEPLRLARIDEARCIGCTLCIDACPVDAILGAPKRMHAVLAAQCTGCELCVAPCPVDCIAMVPAGREWAAQDAADARRRHARREARLARAERVAQRGEAMAQDPAAARKAAVTAAIARARARRAAVAAATP